ncbi:tRNA pseudouridine(38-40) synthase TruA [Halospeciosus flavus]|uniref:tRNA pseudouridine synthase A n=1 Tax=Halospeciosus flavus TaxID=3032283 RepID=A0ABD5Z8H2_9EURY|nr:tRNA pseudouridine(38-40) synthase TruA [Halospeciosus flavus]
MRAFRVAYDGRPYYGFQRQPSVPTVEGVLFDALRALDVLAADDEKPPGYAAAGRTDAGVSAVRQTVAFEAPDWLSPRAFNSQLPAHVRVWASADVPADFHATHHARSRTYVYHLYGPDLDDDRVHDACDRLRGRHDFHNLTPDERNTVRDLAVDVERDGDYVVLTLRAGGFCRELVRRIVSLVDAVGAGTSPVDKVDRVLGPEPVSGPEGVPPAPAHPLVLADADYDVDFEPDAQAVASTREIFEEKHVEWRTRSRVADEVVSRTDT